MATVTAIALKVVSAWLRSRDSENLWSAEARLKKMAITGVLNESAGLFSST